MSKRNNEDFSDFLKIFFHLPPVSTTLVVHLELWISLRIFEKNWNGPNGIIRGFGETDPCRKAAIKNLVFWHCPFKEWRRIRWCQQHQPIFADKYINDDDYCRCRLHREQLISGVNTKVTNISANFHKNLKWSQWDTHGPGGNWFIKKLEPKISLLDSLWWGAS